MRAPTVSDIVRIWELGEGKPSWYRALLLLSPAAPQLSPEELASLSLGHRNALLLQLREELLGRTMEAFVKCPSCRDALEFQIDTREFQHDYSNAPKLQNRRVEVEGASVTYRLWTTRDAAACQNSGADSAEREKLVERCVLETTVAGQAAPLQELTQRGAIVRTVGDELLAIDPLAELKMTLACANCQHTWAAYFDIATFLWSELKRRAESVLSEVHTLAQGYGWREADVLSMTTPRRRYFLEKLA